MSASSNSMNGMVYAAPAELGVLRQRALIVGVIGLALCGVGAFIWPEQFFHSYLLGYVFWTGIALGCLALVMLQHMTGGDWAIVIRRVMEAATRVLPLMLVLFLPIAIGLFTKHGPYPWTHHEGPMTEEVAHKQLYLNIPFFIARTIFYFVVWLSLTYFMNKWSREQDEGRNPRIKRRMQDTSGPGLVLYGLTITFAAIDWVMSLQPEWYSTIFGLLLMIGQALSAMAFVIAIAVVLTRYEPMARVIQPRHLHDLGKLMLAFVMVWAYFNFSQFLIIWSGNLPEETPYYVRRMQTSWRWVGLGIVLFHFVLPFVMLLSRDLKRNANLLVLVALLVILMRVVDLFWMIAPEFHAQGFQVHWMDIVAPIGVGGIWLWFFVGQLKDRPLLPLNEPGLEEAIAHGH